MDQSIAAMVESSLTPLAFTLVLAGVLAAAWRSYGQRYLAFWAAYWLAYALAWPVLAVFYWAQASGHPFAATLLRGGTGTLAFLARGLLVLGTIAYMEWKPPTRAQVRAALALIVALVVCGMFARNAVVTGHAPGWATVPFRSFTLGGLVEIALGVAILRNVGKDQRLPRVVLALAAFVAAASDGWDFFAEVYKGNAWADSPLGLRISLFVSQVTDALMGAGMLVAAIGTERVRANRALEQVKKRDEQLEQVRKIEAAGQLAGGLAHDFNNLLTVIVASLDFIRSRLPQGDPAHQDVDAASLAADRAARLTRQLLTFARRQTVEPRLCNLSDTVASLDRMLAALVGERVTRRVRLAPSLWPVWVDPAQVEQLLVNLVVNSRDAMPQGGVLSVETMNVENASGQWVMVAVEDSGEGMSEETQKRIFEPFFTTKGAGKGTGLGLATVYGIVQQAGGSIDVRSAPGRGTRFEVFLPRSRGDLPESVPTPRPPRRGLEKILLVENEAGVRTAAARALAANGYAVIEAAGGAQALQAPLDGIALAIVDIVMPGMDGWELARELRKRRPLQPVLFISGFVPSNDTARDDGPSSFLPKPFTPEQLVRRVSEMIEHTA